MKKHFILLLTFTLIFIIIFTPNSFAGQTDKTVLIKVNPIASGYSNSFFITSDHSLYACGYNIYGQIGDGTRQTRIKPVKILSDAVSVAVSTTKAYAITNNGDLYSWGSQDTPKRAIDYSDVISAFDQNESANKIDISLKPRKIMSGIWHLDCYYDGALVINKNLELYEISNNNTKKLIMKDIIDAGEMNGIIVVVKKDGTLWSWGKNPNEEFLGDGTRGRRSEPKQILTDVASIKCGQHHCLVLKSDGSLWAWGHNSSGELGLGKPEYPETFAINEWEEDKALPTKVMDNVKSIGAFDSSSFAIREDNSLWVWGDVLNYNIPIELHRKGIPYKAFEDVAYATVNSSHIIVVKKDGTLWAWGLNASGEFGNGQSLYVEKPTVILENVSDFSVTDNYALAIKKDGSVWGSGILSNERHIIYDETKFAFFSNIPVKIHNGAKDVAAAQNHCLILDNNGSVWALGENSYGKLGDGTTNFAFKPVKVMDDVLEIDADQNTSMALKKDGTLWAWGENTQNDKMDTVYPARKVGENVECFKSAAFDYWMYIDKKGKLHIPNESKSYLVYDVLMDKEGKSYHKDITYPLSIKNIYYKEFYYKYKFFLTLDGKVFRQMHFANNDNSTKFGFIMDGVKYIAGCSGNIPNPDVNKDKVWLYVVKFDGRLIDTENNETLLRNINKAEFIGATMFALSNDGKLYAWGRNDYGKVGNGTQGIQYVPKQYRTGILTEVLIPLK